MFTFIQLGHNWHGQTEQLQLPTPNTRRNRSNPLDPDPSPQPVRHVQHGHVRRATEPVHAASTRQPSSVHADDTPSVPVQLAAADAPLHDVQPIGDGTRIAFPNWIAQLAHDAHPVHWHQ